MLDDTTEALEIEPGQRGWYSKHEVGQLARLWVEIAVDADADGLVSIAEMSPTALLSWFPAGTGGRIDASTARRCATRLPGLNAARKRPSSTRDSLVVRFELLPGAPRSTRWKSRQSGACRVHAASPCTLPPGCAEAEAR